MATIFPPSPAVNDEHSNYRWNGTAWKLIGQVYNPTVYENEPPVNPQTGDIWIDANENVPSVSPETVITINGSQTLTNKTMAGSSNTFSAIPQAAITSLTTDLALKAPLSGPTFTGTVVLPSTTSIGNVSSTEIGYVDGVTSAIQTQLNAKAVAGASGVPFAMAANSTFFNTGVTSATVTLPAGRFTQAPMITTSATPTGNVAFFSLVYNITTTSFTQYLYGGSYTGGTVSAYWIAVQMTSGAAGG